MLISLLFSLAEAGPWYEGCTLAETAAQQTIECGSYRANFADYPGVDPQTLHDEMVRMSIEVAQGVMEVVAQESVSLKQATQATLVTYKQERPDLFALYAAGAREDGARKADCSIRAPTTAVALDRCRVVVESLLENGVPTGLPKAQTPTDSVTLEAILGTVAIPASCQTKGDARLQQATCEEGLYHAAVVPDRIDPAVAAKSMIETLHSGLPEQTRQFVGPTKEAACEVLGVATTCVDVFVGPPDDPGTLRILGAPHRTDAGNAIVICSWQGDQPAPCAAVFTKLP